MTTENKEVYVYKGKMMFTFYCNELKHSLDFPIFISRLGVLFKRHIKFSCEYTKFRLQGISGEVFILYE